MGIFNLLYSHSNTRECLKLIQYDDTHFRILYQPFKKKSGLEPVELSKTENKFSESERVSLCRTKSTIRELALCNNFTFFGTITVSSSSCDRYSLDSVQNLLKKYLHKIHRITHDFKYIVITEKHKDGAFHFHGLFSGLDLYYNEFGYLYSPKFSEIGYNSFSPIRDYFSCCNYILKYITSDCVRNSKNQIYFRSRNLVRAPKIELDLDFISSIKDWSYENDFCKFLDIDLNSCYNDDIKNLLYKLCFSEK